MDTQGRQLVVEVRLVELDHRDVFGLQSVSEGLQGVSVAHFEHDQVVRGLAMLQDVVNAGVAELCCPQARRQIPPAHGVQLLDALRWIQTTDLPSHYTRALYR